MEVAPSLRSREAAGLGWGPCPFGSRLQLIWGHLQKKCLLSDHEGQGAWGTLLPPACGPVLLSCTDPPLGCPPGRHPVPSVGTGPSHGVRRKLPSRVCPGTLSSHGSLGPCPPPPGAGWLRNPLLGCGLIGSSPRTGRPRPTLPASSQAPKCPNRQADLRPKHVSQGPLSLKNSPKVHVPVGGDWAGTQTLGPLPFTLSAEGGGEAGHSDSRCLVGAGAASLSLQ